VLREFDFLLKFCNYFLAFLTCGVKLLEDKKSRHLFSKLVERDSIVLVLRVSLGEFVKELSRSIF